MTGPKNTLRFYWPQEEYPVMARDDFAKELLIGFLGLKLEEVLCLQDNPRDKGYDVTFHDNGTLTRVKDFLKKEFRKMDRNKMLKGLRIYDLFPKEMRLVTVHMYDPHVKEGDIVAFLGGFGRVYTDDVEKVMDRAGFWTGKRTFHVKLNSDPNGQDGLAHPPAFFAIGADRGYLSYHRQPPFCKKCRVSGHNEKKCGEGAICRFCSSKEHGTKDCPRPRECHACGSLDHLLKDCPGRGVAGGGNRPGKGAETSGRKEASLKTAAAPRAAKDGDRTGSQAFNGAEVAEHASYGGKKVKTLGEREETMDSTQSGGEISVGGLGMEGVEALSYDTRQPACLFGPNSPGTEQGPECPSYIK